VSHGTSASASDLRESNAGSTGTPSASGSSKRSRETSSDSDIVVSEVQGPVGKAKTKSQERGAKSGTKKSRFKPPARDDQFLHAESTSTSRSRSPSRGAPATRSRKDVRAPAFADATKSFKGMSIGGSQPGSEGSSVAGSQKSSQKGSGPSSQRGRR
jgi:hypothetical protein